MWVNFNNPSVTAQIVNSENGFVEVELDGYAETRWMSVATFKNNFYHI